MTDIKRILFLGVILLGIINYSFSQKTSIVAENYCKIFFGEGFGRTERDSINFSVNNINIHENCRLYSLSYGLAPGGGILIIRVNKKIIACTTEEYPERMIYLGRIKRKNSIAINAIFRGKKYQFMIDLTKGKFLVFDVSYEGLLEYSQHLKPPTFA